MLKLFLKRNQKWKMEEKESICEKLKID